MAQTSVVKVDRAEVRDAFDFVSLGELLGAEAYISLDTGKVYLRTVDGDVMEEDEVPEDVETSDRYIAVPHKAELDLGRRLALRFTEQELPGDYDAVRDLFRGRARIRASNDCWKREARSSGGTTMKSVPPRRPFELGAKTTAFS